MVTLSKKHLVYVCLACLLAGWWLSSSEKSPVGPQPQPSRPVLRFIAKAAKNALWFMLIAEPPPEAKAEQRLVRSEVGDDGFPLLNHAGAL
jgi:hypothetical protein